ncbi:MAG: hypothetical protein Hens3KO_06050 [Henriciella sp.]
MGFTRKPSNENGLLDLKQSSEYRAWPNSNVSYGTIPAPRDVLTKPRSDEAVITKQSLVGTAVFLFVLLLVGFIAGYSLRGSAHASASSNGLVSLVMTSIPAPQSLAAESSRSKLVASFGSEAPDELLAFEAASGDNLSALVRLHSSGADDSDRISLMNVASDGSMQELLRQDAAGVRSIDMSRLPNGEFVTATLYPSIMQMRGITPDGKTLWSRDILTAENHSAPVKVAAMPFATAIVGPSETSNRIGLTYLSNSGELIWQRSFPADTEKPDVRLVPNRDGSVFLIMRNPADIGRGTHSLVRVDREGQDIWRTSLELEDDATRIELASSDEGGAFLLVTGQMPVLTKFGQFGDALWSSQIPQAKFFNSVHLLTTDQGNAITAVSYSIGDERLDVWLEERNKIGEVTGEGSLTLPGTSSITAVTEASSGRYLLAGSIQADPFGDADIFVKDVAFQPAALPSRQPPVDLTYSELSLATSETVISDALSETSGEPAEREEIVLAAAPASSEIDAQPVPEAIIDEQTSISIQELAPVVEVAAMTVQNEVTEQAIDDGVALSRFINFNDRSPDTRISIEPSIRAQCRFSCLEEGNTSVSFPMWRAIEAPQSLYNAGLPNMHEQTCQAAGGEIDLNRAPDCQPY